MSTNAITPSHTASTAAPATDASPANGSANKGKGKVAPADESMEEDEDEEEEEEEEEEEDDIEEDDDLHEIDPSAILAPGTRRTRGVKVDYSSEEALRKAGLKPEAEDDENEDSFVVHDDDMHAD